MKNDNEILALLTLQAIPKIGDITAKKLIAHCKSAEAIFSEKKHILAKIEGIGTSILNGIFESKYRQQAENEWKYITENNIQFCTYADENYPVNLAQTIDGPILFFYNGNIQLKHKKILSIVGTRQITPYGQAFCEQFIENLTPLKHELVIVSGYAYGVDICAHKAAIKNNMQTIGCLAHGLDIIYPASHKKYALQVMENGGFITDFWHNCNFDRKNFLRRNRIIAGLADATLVIESAEKGGSLVTADIANSYNREVFALPGRFDAPFSAGCNALIKNNQAQLITSANDFLQAMNWDNTQPKHAPALSLFPELTSEENTIYNYLKNNGKQDLDSLSRLLNIPVFKLSNTLFQMEMKGVIIPYPGKFFDIK